MSEHRFIFVTFVFTLCKHFISTRSSSRHVEVLGAKKVDGAKKIYLNLFFLYLCHGEEAADFLLYFLCLKKVGIMWSQQYLNEVWVLKHSLTCEFFQIFSTD